MATFTIDTENNITGYASGEAIPDNDSERFTTESELAQLAAQWPAARLVEVWNSIPGLAPVRKFTSRKTAVARIWKAAQSLVSGSNAQDVRTKPILSGCPNGPKAQRWRSSWKPPAGRPTRCAGSSRAPWAKS